MNKKLIISLILSIALIFSMTFCYAMDNENGIGKAEDDVRNFVGGVENTVENATRDVSNVSKDATGSVENDMGNMTNNKSGSNSTYETSRVSTDEPATIMGMNQTTWTWVIITIAAIAIIAVVWYYSMQFTSTRNHHDDDRYE